MHQADSDIITPAGMAAATDADWLALERRLDESTRWGADLDSRKDAPKSEWDQWTRFDDAVFADIKRRPARSLTALRIKAKAVLRCDGCSGLDPNKIRLSVDPTTDVLLAEDIVRGLLAMEVA